MGCLRTATVLGLTLASWLIILSTRDLQVKLSPRALMVDWMMIISMPLLPSAIIIAAPYVNSSYLVSWAAERMLPCLL